MGGACANRKVLEPECLDFDETIEDLIEKTRIVRCSDGGQHESAEVAPEKFQEKIFQEVKELEEQLCDSSKIKRMQLISTDGKAIPHLGGTGKILVAFFL